MGLIIHEHLKTYLGVETTIGDPVLYTKTKDGQVIGVSGSYVNYLLNAELKRSNL